MSFPDTNFERFLKPGIKSYNIPIQYRHWQLRDMLRFNKNQLIYPIAEKLAYQNVLNQENGEENGEENGVLVENLFNPATAFDLNDEFIVCGTSRGEVSVINRITQSRQDFYVGTSIVNSVKVKDNFIIVCSNERTISMIDIYQNHVLGVYSHNTQVNNCEISPNSKYLVACGDTKEVLFFDVSNKCLSYIKSLVSVEDGGFGVSWNSANSFFAVGTQDGYACIWDYRIDKKFQTLKSSLHCNSGGAIRNLQFTKKNLSDILIWTEHTSNFMIYDTRTFKKNQIMSINTAEKERNITGLALDEERNKVYISNNENVLEYTLDYNLRRVSSFGNFC